MKLVKASTFVLALGAAFAIGVWTGPSIRMARTETASPVVQVEQPVAAEAAPKPAVRVARTVVQPSANPFEPVMVASAPSVQKLAGAVLNQGTNVEVAAEGFNDATLFVSTAYAARNTGIPFMLLKHRMLTGGLTLSEAIRMSKPELDAVVEMERARTKAREVVQRLGT